AKHAYVASRSGWFSDRSTCFLAAGRPVLHQDTGCGDWLPTGEGVLLFSDMDTVLECLRSIEDEYERHARAARALAEEYFEAGTVVGRMLDDAGFR
ncbi:MAG: glycosyltransferase, partial [Gemmatimonadaceae bacterium]